MTGKTLIIENLMTIKDYIPYCGRWDDCNNPRSYFDGTQFVCPNCGWRSDFPNVFIERYKTKWGIK